MSELPKLLEHATPAEKKELVREWMEGMRLAPEQLEVAITYRVPEPVANKLVAGARFVADSEQLPVVNAHWRYQGAKHAERVMVRVGVIP